MVNMRTEYRLAATGPDAAAALPVPARRMRNCFSTAGFSISLKTHKRTPAKCRKRTQTNPGTRAFPICVHPCSSVAHGFPHSHRKPLIPRTVPHRNSPEDG